MRVEQVEIEGGGPLSGVLAFPPDGVGLWLAKNDVPEGALAEAVACALYGPPPAVREEPPYSRVVLHLVTDEGTRVVVDRSLTQGSFAVTEDGVPDLSAEGEDVGRRLFGLSRDEFLEVAWVRQGDLRATLGNERLAGLLGRFATAAPAETPPPPPAAAASPSPEDADALDLAIERSPFETSRQPPSAPPELLGDLERFADAPAPAADTEALPDSATPVERLRHLRRRLAGIERALTLRTQELHEVSERREELRAENGRLGLLADSEPADLARLSELADLLVSALSRRTETARERAAFEQVLAQKGLDLPELRDLEGRFTALSDDEREFLAGLDQAATIRRGNLALTRSECRLDESQIGEIERGRQTVARGAMVPLGLAAIALFAALATSMLHVNGLVSTGLLLAGLAGGGYAGRTFWAARSDREDERLALFETLDRKRRQIAQLEGEGQESERELARLASRASDGSVRKLRSDWARWSGARAALQDLEAFSERDRELEETIAGLRAKLGAFDIGGDPDRELDVGRLQAMVDDYQRSFRLRTDLAAADEQAAQLEAGIVPIESERAEVRLQIDAMLMAADIDPNRDLDEAVEMFVLRAPVEMASVLPVESTPPPIPPETPPIVPATPERPRTVPETAVDQPPTWMPRISAAAEAILRCLVPEARDLAVDEHLHWSVKLDPRGGRLSPTELERTRSAAAVDQVCLALRLAIVETLSALGERLPVFLDEPWARADDERHARGMTLLVESVATRGQVVVRTAHEVRVKWSLHQNPTLRVRISWIGSPAAAPSPSPSSFSPAASGR